MNELNRVLIVEDDSALRSAMGRIVGLGETQVAEASSLSEAKARLDSFDPELVLLDVRLPDGSGVELAELAARRRPKPTVVAISGGASAAEAFELARAGVSTYLEKPFSIEALREAVEAARRWVPSLEPFVKESVGKRELLDLVAAVRGTMVDEALAQSAGSRRGAARRLGVSRQAVQQIVRKREGDEPIRKRATTRSRSS